MTVHRLRPSISLSRGPRSAGLGEQPEVYPAPSHNPSLSLPLPPLCLILHLAFASSSSDVSLHVQRQVVRSRETPVAVIALERLCAGVFAVMPRQLIAPCETPLAAFP